MWLITLQLGVRNLLLHKLRSFLTMLGTILGVGSVIAMLAIGEGSKREAVDQIRKLGASNVIIRSVKPDRSNGDDVQTTSGTTQQETSRVIEYGLTYADYDRLQATLPTVRRTLPIALVRRDARCGRLRLANARVLGTTPSYMQIKHIELRRGRFLTQADLDSTANVAVLAAGAARRLFAYRDPLGETIILGDRAFRVVGVMRPQDSGSATPGAVGGEDMNEDIYVPITAASKRFGELQVIVRAGSRDYERTQLSEITLTVHDETKVSQTAAMARAVLKKSHPRADDYEIQVPLELLREAEQQKRIWNLVLGSIAGISLLVGGIGIMNIMLATVTERTREIGIRRALGATRANITGQFLVETTVLSSTGGTLGVLVGVAIPLLVSRAANIQTFISLWSIALAFGISVATGVVFGIYPARRAAMMDPIEALRHE